MLESMWAGIQYLGSVDVWLLMMLAIVVGNVIGAIPGIGGNFGLAVLIPFVFGMEPFLGLAFLLAMHSVVHTGGAIPGILFSVPGTGPTAATIIDGYQMTRQGRGGQAIGAALASSAFGGVLGAAALAVLIPGMRLIAMGLGSGEIFMLIVWGLTFIVVVSRESIPRGFAMVLLGLGLGTIGLDPFTGVGRFTFGQVWLYDGIHIVTIVLGIFAIAEMIDLGARGRGVAIAEVGEVMRFSQLWEGTIETFREWWLMLRTSLIGVFIGIIPGLGGDVASWVCYGHAVQTCKNNQNFGKGDIRGVIAPEGANNAKEGGALLPTVVFGIPGSSGMAIMLGAFLILGITPGPKMITDHLDLVWGMVYVLVIANIIGAAMIYPLGGVMGKLAYLRNSLLIPAVLAVVIVGAFLIRRMWTDVALALLFGLMGYGMKKGDFPRGPLILGFILGPLAEGYLHKALGTMGIAFLTRPVVMVFTALTILSLLYSVWQHYQDKKKARGEVK